MGDQETGQTTGTKDKDYNLIWFTEQCLSNALRMEVYAQDAGRDGDSELAGFFQRAQGESRKGAELDELVLSMKTHGFETIAQMVRRSTRRSVGVPSGNRSERPYQVHAHHLAHRDRAASPVWRLRVQPPRATRTLGSHRSRRSRRVR